MTITHEKTSTFIYRENVQKMHLLEMVGVWIRYAYPISEFQHRM